MIQIKEIKANNTSLSGTLFARSDNEIVFGEFMGFMDYRFSMRMDTDKSDKLEVSTVVKLNTKMGKYYFAVVKLIHKKFVNMSLHNLIKAIQG